MVEPPENVVEDPKPDPGRDESGAGTHRRTADRSRPPPVDPPTGNASGAEETKPTPPAIEPAKPPRERPAPPKSREAKARARGGRGRDLRRFRHEGRGLLSGDRHPTFLAGPRSAQTVQHSAQLGARTPHLKPNTMSDAPAPRSNPDARLIVFPAVTFVMMSVLGMRFFYFQVVKAPEIVERAGLQAGRQVDRSPSRASAEGFSKPRNSDPRAVAQGLEVRPALRRFVRSLARRIAQRP